MAFPVNQIGEFQFIALQGDPIPPAQHLEVEHRAGVDGISIARLGVQGVPFRMLSQVDQASYSKARREFIKYQKLQGDEPQLLIHNNLVSTDEDYKVQVLRVWITPGGLRRIAGASGGLNSPSLAMLECEWELIAVSI